MSVTFDYAQKAEQLERILKEEFGANAAIQTAEGWHGRVHVKIVSNVFNGKSEEEKQEMIWSILRERLGADAQTVSLVLAYSLDEI